MWLGIIRRINNQVEYLNCAQQTSGEGEAGGGIGATGT
jgi:hypothetical protein